MTVRELYEAAIELGIALDPRSQETLDAELARRRQEFDALPDWKKPYFDHERLRNPYGDVRIVNGPEDAEVFTALSGINIGTDEFLIADRLKEKGVPLDAIIAHHTSGTGIGRSHIDDITLINIDIFVREGVPRAEAEKVLLPWIDEWRTGYDDMPHRMGPDMARLFEIPFVQIHTPQDLYIGVGMRQVFDDLQPHTLADAEEALMTIPEFQGAARHGAYSMILAGEPDTPLGRYIIQDAGGWLWPPEAQPLFAKAGINTVLQIGASAAVAEAAKEVGVSVVRLPHAAADNLGINLFYDEIERRFGPLHIIPCNYFERIRHA